MKIRWFNTIFRSIKDKWTKVWVLEKSLIQTTTGSTVQVQIWAWSLTKWSTVVDTLSWRPRAEMNLDKFWAKMVQDKTKEWWLTTIIEISKVLVNFHKPLEFSDRPKLGTLREIRNTMLTKATCNLTRHTSNTTSSINDSNHLNVN